MSFSDPFRHWMQVVHIYSGKILTKQNTKIGVFKKLEIYFVINKNNYIGWHFNFCTCTLYKFYVLAKLYFSSPVQYLKKKFVWLRLLSILIVTTLLEAVCYKPVFLFFFSHSEHEFIHVAFKISYHQAAFLSLISITLKLHSIYLSSPFKMHSFHNII